MARTLPRRAAARAANSQNQTALLVWAARVTVQRKQTQSGDSRHGVSLVSESAEFDDGNGKKGAVAHIASKDN
jgi:hypothetical protein